VGVLELIDGLLELLVKHHSVGNDHYLVEDFTVVRVVEAGEAVGEPGDGVGLT